MRKIIGLFSCFCLGVLTATAQEVAEQFTQQELSVIEAIKAKNRTAEELAEAAPPPPPPQSPMQAPVQMTDTAAPDNTIQLSEQAKQAAWQEQQTADKLQQAPAQAAATAEPAIAQEQTEPAAEQAPQKCLTVAFIDIDVAFNEHPRTQAVKKQIDTKIKSKQREVESAHDIINALRAENQMLARQLAEIKPFYERIVTDQQLLPKVPETTDSLTLSNTLNRLLFAGCEVLSTTPLDTPSRLDDVTERIGANKKIIAERSFFIDNYKYQTREEILKLEQEEVKAILQDIYSEIKTFAKKRNIGAVVRKDEILYGQDPVNVTKDFVDRLKKSKKYRKKK